LDITLKAHLSLSDRILDIIEKAILSGSIKPGERLIETELAKNLGISKSPVREALKRLEGVGIVGRIPRKGYFVRDIDRKSIEDFFDVMLILEPAAALLSLKKKSETVCSEIDEILSHMERCLRKKQYESYRILNDQFHGLFYRLTENEWIIKISQILRKQAYMLRSLSLGTKDRFSYSLEEHQAIDDAYKQGDKRLLEKAVKNHVIMFKENILHSDFVRENFSVSDTNSVKRKISQVVINEMNKLNLKGGFLK
jgi:DNA-binding GntR family transcriptional regulator